MLGWIQDAPDYRPVLRYEDLAADAAGAVDAVMSRPAPDVAPDVTAEIPSFATPHATDPGFFRRGRSASHVDEMPNASQELFWSKPDNTEAMGLLGYG